jgi:hypothetical protein
MELWQPSEESKDIAVIFEDDLTVLPFFYRYLRNRPVYPYLYFV